MGSSPWGGGKSPESTAAGRRPSLRPTFNRSAAVVGGGADSEESDGWSDDDGKQTLGAQMARPGKSLDTQIAKSSSLPVASSTSPLSSNIVVQAVAPAAVIARSPIDIENVERRDSPVITNQNHALEAPDRSAEGLQISSLNDTKNYQEVEQRDDKQSDRLARAEAKIKGLEEEVFYCHLPQTSPFFLNSKSHLLLFRCRKPSARFCSSGTCVIEGYHCRIALSARRGSSAI